MPERSNTNTKSWNIRVFLNWFRQKERDFFVDKNNMQIISTWVFVNQIPK